MLGCVASDDRDSECTDDRDSECRKTLLGTYTHLFLLQIKHIRICWTNKHHHLDSCRIKLDKLEDVGLTCTHLISCCMVSARYSILFMVFC